MKFGPVETSKAVGTVLAHSLSLPTGRLPKGITLRESDVAKILNAGIASITVAKLDVTDVHEDLAAKKVAQCFSHEHFNVTEPVAGRVNLCAKSNGLADINTQAVIAANLIDEAITIATVSDKSRVAEAALVATIKIIPYAANTEKLQRVLEVLADAPIKLIPFQMHPYDLILTKTAGFKPSLLTKGREVVASRVTSIGLKEKECLIVDHTDAAVSDALNGTHSKICLILGASAPSDMNDVVPSAITNLGGTIDRFGMPVDPGNLLVLGRIKDRTIIGLPGCARAPALNGADWVLERIAADQTITREDFAKMAVGGLLKEIPERTQPRMKSQRPSSSVSALVMAAGASRRMRGENKLLRQIDGEPLIKRAVKQILQSKAQEVIVVVPPENKELKEALAGLDVKFVVAKDPKEGLSASIRAGVLAASETTAGILLCFSDMPDLTYKDVNLVISEFHKDLETDIVVPVDSAGKRGHPVLFDKRYREALLTLRGDTGGKTILDASQDRITLVPMRDAVTTDLDTPEAWHAWTRGQ